MENDNSKEIKQRSQQGGGSAENIGEGREAQKARNTVVGSDERKNIAEQTGLKPEDITDIQDTGALSGRDDASGGSGDDMTGTSSGEATEKF